LLSFCRDGRKKAPFVLSFKPFLARRRQFERSLAITLIMQSHLRQSGITSKIASVEHDLNARISRLTSSPSYILRPIRQLICLM